MINEKVAGAINKQANRELYSAYFYLGMAYYAASIGLKGFANWFHAQVKEEAAHAQKFYDYLIQQGSRVMLSDIETPPQDFTSGLDLFKRTLEHEKKVTGLIHNLVALSREEKDKTTEDFLKWYVKEQVEEEESAGGVLKKVQIAGDNKDALMKLDGELAKRRIK